MPCCCWPCHGLAEGLAEGPAPRAARTSPRASRTPAGSLGRVPAALPARTQTCRLSPAPTAPGARYGDVVAGEEAASHGHPAPPCPAPPWRGPRLTHERFRPAAKPELGLIHKSLPLCQREQRLGGSRGRWRGHCCDTPGAWCPQGRGAGEALPPCLGTRHWGGSAGAPQRHQHFADTLPSLLCASRAAASDVRPAQGGGRGLAGLQLSPVPEPGDAGRDAQAGGSGQGGLCRRDWAARPAQRLLPGHSPSSGFQAWAYPCP